MIYLSMRHTKSDLILANIVNISVVKQYSTTTEKLTQKNKIFVEMCVFICLRCYKNTINALKNSSRELARNPLLPGGPLPGVDPGPAFGKLIKILNGLRLNLIRDHWP